MGEIHELFVLALSLVWFAGATPDKRWQFHTAVCVTAERCDLCAQCAVVNSLQNRRKRGAPEESKDLPLCRTLKILGKRAKTHKKARKTKKGNLGGSGMFIG